MNFKRIIGPVFAAPVFAGLLVIELAKLAYHATAYAAEVVYDGIRYNDWYL